MALRTTQTGLDLLLHMEGERLKGYYCPAHVATIGVGHTAATGEVIHYADGTVTTKVIIGKAIAQAESRRILAADVDRFEDQVERLLAGVNVSPHAFDACVSLAYNIGVGAFARSTCLRKLKTGDVRGAAQALKAFNKANGQVMPGLVRRRDAEAALMLSDLKTVSVAMNDNFPDMPQHVDEAVGDFTMAA